MGYSTKTASVLSSRDFLKMQTLSYMIKKNDSAYGREIIQHIRERSDAWTPSHSSLYPLLNEMVAKEMIYIYDIDKESKIKRYKLTAKGVNYYKDKSESFKDTLKKTSRFFDEMAEDLIIL